MYNMNILITGINGQDGSNLAKYIINMKNKNYIIYGTTRKNSNLDNIKNIVKNINITEIDFINDNEIENMFLKIQPDIIFHFASAQPQTEKNNFNLFKINTLSTLQFLECINKYKKTCKFLSAGSCMEFGNNTDLKVNLSSNYKPDTIYGISKLNNNYLVEYYRNNYSIFATHVVLFSHESSARNDIFLTKKIAKKIINIKKNIDNNVYFEPLEIGNIYSTRDWSDSDDFIEAMWLMMNQQISKNYILSSGIEHTVKEYIELCCFYINLTNLKWEINEMNTKLFSNGVLILKTNEQYYRNNDFAIIGDNYETLKYLNWKPKITFEKMVENIIYNCNNES
jgi:GDPmannose 4,6-dehydratase